MASIIGTLFGIGCLAFLTPLLTELALKFTSAEFFLVGLFGVLISGALTGGDIALKGWVGGIFGLAIGMVGTDELSAWQRMTFGSPELFGGIPFIPIMIGFFGIPQVIEALTDEQDVLVAVLDKTKVKLKDITKHWWVAIRSGMIGVGIGIIPGVGEDVASWTPTVLPKSRANTPRNTARAPSRAWWQPRRRTTPASAARSFRCFRWGSRAVLRPRSCSAPF
jgi:putative tricarboxylic transport membrane protein